LTRQAEDYDPTDEEMLNIEVADLMDFYGLTEEEALAELEAEIALEGAADDFILNEE
jgi:sulfur carrier protein ThiS